MKLKIRKGINTRQEEAKNRLVFRVIENKLNRRKKIIKSKNRLGELSNTIKCNNIYRIPEGE